MVRKTPKDMYKIMLEKLEEQNDFEYIKGYTALNSDARFKCKHCNEIVFLKPRVFIYNKNLPVCYKCGEKHQSKRDFYTIENLNKNVSDKSKIAIEINEEYIVYKCSHCNHKYRYYNVQSMQSINFYLESKNKCCKNGISKAEKRAKTILRECWSSMDNEFLYPEDIEDYIKDYFGFLKEELKCFVDVEYIQNYVIEGFLKRYKKEHIKECDYCGEMVRGKVNWDKDEIACRRCYERQFICQCCGKEKKLKSFSIKDGEYLRHCKDCESVINDLENGIENNGWLYTYYKDDVDKYFKKYMKRKQKGEIKNDK